MVTVIKRDGRRVEFDPARIGEAVYKAARNDADYDISDAMLLSDTMIDWAKGLYGWQEGEVTVEEIQDAVEVELMGCAPEVAKEYILYRKKRSDIREGNTELMRAMHDLMVMDAADNDAMRENANVNADAPMGAMLKYGSTVSKHYYLKHMMSEKYADAHVNGDIHIHDLDFYGLTMTCCQIDLEPLFERGFSTGHGYIRTPNGIASYASLACIVLQADQNDQHGGQSVCMFDYNMAPGVAKTFITNLANILWIRNYEGYDKVKKALREYAVEHKWRIINPDGEAIIRDVLAGKLGDDVVTDIINKATAKTVKDTYQAMESLIHNLNTMNSRAGAQVPFTSINFGTDTSAEGRMVVKQFLLALEAGLGSGETSIFPISIFKVRSGYSANPGDPNYDLFKLACRVSAKRLFPNFVFLDAPFNKVYHRGSDPRYEVATMGCRTRVIGDIVTPDNQQTPGRGNLSFTTINLPRIAMRHKGDIEGFFAELKEKLTLVEGQLLERFEVQKRRKVYNYPFLMGQGVWIGSDKLSRTDEVGEIIRHGTLTIGFIALAETLKALIGKHHGESPEAQELGLRIVSFMRQHCDEASKRHTLNFSLIATPAEGLAGRMVRKDKEEFGNIPEITDREYYTNSFHVPVYYEITAHKKIEIEAPYHDLCNGGHITYVEVDGDPSKNVEAFETLIKFMGEKGCGYVSINHPADYCPVCRYTGVIGDVCPRCGRREGEGITEEKLEEIKHKYWK